MDTQPPCQLVSTHGRKLLRELRNNDSASGPCLEEILKFIKLDPIAGRFCDAETGNNSFHILFSSRFETSFILAVLCPLLEVASNGLKRKNKDGYFPLQLYLLQPKVDSEVVSVVLKALPSCASLEDDDGFIPLFYWMMRDDATVDICKQLCKANPAGPSTLNRTKSYPLHFATKRRRPNLDILRVLLKRNNAAARQINDYGMLPIHCLAGSSDNDTALKLLIDAYPESVAVQDRQGRLPLHLAVLAVGKEHTLSIAREKVELQFLQFNAAETDDAGVDLDDDDVEPENIVNELQERPGMSRAIIRMLIEAYPRGLVVQNHFQAIPLDTVLEISKPSKSNRRIVNVYGLYDDAPTARLLLHAHRKYSALGVIQSLQLRYNRPFRDLNWLARRSSLLVSYQFDEALSSNKRGIKAASTVFQKSNRNLPSSANRCAHADVDEEALKRNILARLRRHGNLDLIRCIVAFI